MDTTHIPDRHLYRPVYAPWTGEPAFLRYYERAKGRTLVSADRCYVLQTLLRQAMHVEGDIWECGVYRGGTAAMMASMLHDLCDWKRLYLFDTFAGMPPTDAQRDLHKAGDFSDTSLDEVQAFVGHAALCVYRQGYIPQTLAGLEGRRIAMAHVDLDIYQSILDALEFIWPRLSVGGLLVFDDYGFPTCPGARLAVDRFFSAKTAVPLCLPTGQAIVFKSGT